MATIAAAASVACGEDPQGRRASATPDSRDGGTVPRPAGVGAHLRELQRIARTHDGTRAAGTPGDRATADYVARRLRLAGYAVSRQRVSFPHFEVTGPPRVSSPSGVLRGGRRTLRPLQYTPAGSVRGRLRRIGTDCSAAQAAALEPGEVAVVRRGVCTFRRKAELAAEGGAAALLVAGRRGEPLVNASLQRPGVSVPSLLVAQAAARALEAGEMAGPS